MGDLQSNLNQKLLGAGRSGQVFLVDTQAGQIARKVFSGDTLAGLVHHVFLGADNAYIWNEDFLQCAYYRRNILVDLTQYWFDSKLKVAKAIELGWNEEFKANQLDTEYVSGRNVALHQPINKIRNQEFSQLLHKIMEPLQKRLIEAGFDGLVWQAGKGNPVALNNFLIIDSDVGDPTFAWIDMESSVPALFPLNVLTLFTFYIPKSIKYRRALFDDVDTCKLKKYVSDRQEDLEREIGKERYQKLLKNINQLEKHQKKWRSLTRIERAIYSHLKKGKISQTQAKWYLKHPLRWYFKGFKKVVIKVSKTLFIGLPAKVFNKLCSISYLGFVKGFWKLIFSKKYRSKTPKDYVIKRIELWQDRKQLTPEEAELLLQRLNEESSSDYLSDFGVQIGMKFFVKVTQYGFFPLVYAAGLINEITLGIILLTGGLICRTIYTIYRMFQAAAEGKELPWVALLFGIFPLMLGNLAYLFQMLYSASGERGKVAKFIIYDIFTQIGEKIPVWGGKDTLTEHFFNHWADRIVYYIGFLKSKLR